MKAFILSPEAERYLDAITSYLLKEAGISVTRYVMRELRAGMRLLGKNPGLGHAREDLTEDPVKFWAIFSYLIVYDPAKRPVEIARILHGKRHVEETLK